MLTATRTTKAGTIKRTILLGIDRETLGTIAVVSEAKQGKRSERIETAGYRLRRIASKIGGVAVKIEKEGDAELRHVLLRSPRGNECDCAWGTYRPDAKPCRHLEMALEALLHGMI